MLCILTLTNSSNRADRLNRTRCSVHSIHPTKQEQKEYTATSPAEPKFHSAYWNCSEDRQADKVY